MKVLFWNIENFTGANPGRAEKVIRHIREAGADVLGFSEIKDKAALRSILQDSLHDYDFGITDGLQGIELLAGWRRGEFEQALFTQRREFKADNPHLRPGSLLSVKKRGKFFNFLFLHTDSGRKERDYNNRQDMFEKIWAMRKRLEDIEGQESKLIVLGDLNTMGKSARGRSGNITGQEEVEELKRDAANNEMKLFDKSHNNTWARVKSSGEIEMESNLDHVIASNTITLNDLGGGTRVRVRGWVNAATDSERLEFVEHISDHCSIECEVSDTAS
ncbi:MAG: endonuclease/exonuclease/phosphatase family protein [Alphaproteobacteria bacterium]|nr:endonuclease/exonuclease/phosphatase family protein [Alphaproteobacteria bacterium]